MLTTHFRSLRPKQPARDATVMVANKTVRTAWSLLARGVNYRPRANTGAAAACRVQDLQGPRWHKDHEHPRPDIPYSVRTR